MENQDLKKRVCVYCGGYLKTIGLTRKNGNNMVPDWKTRKSHKKCYKYYIVYNDFDVIMNNLTDMQP